MPSILFGAFFTLAVAWMLGNICLHRLPVPPTIALAVGAAAESFVIFLLLIAGLAGWISFALLGAVCLAILLWLRRTAPPLVDPVKQPADRVTWWIAWAALASYAVLYLINALAPELEPDAVAYHLGLTAEYVRLGGFPSRVGFYEMVPQGLEMLFVPAFAIGKHSAARLVHCALLLATAPLMLSIARRLGLPDRAGLAAAALYFCAPMVGITGTSTYTDPGAVFFELATFYLLLVWRDTRDIRYLVPAGITAGFCYAIKLPGGLVVILALAFVIATERAIRPRELSRLALAALLMIAPWVLRAAIMTGNPLAPLFNRLFPNEFFHPAMELDLAAALGSWRGVPPWRVPYEMIVGGAYQGILGVAFFALPIALLALRKPVGRLCWLAAALLALPWFYNTGGRFLMPSLPFLALALAMSLPRQAQWAAIVVQAVACWPQIFPLYHPAYTWRLERIPWRAALRLQPEAEYLAAFQGEYRIARLIEDHTQPGDRVFSLAYGPAAYTSRVILGFWHSAQADNLNDALRVALAPKDVIYNVRAEWPPRPLEALRIRVPQAAQAEWLIHEIQFLSSDGQIPNSPYWQLRAWPNVWDLPLAFDDNQATRWRTWQPIRAGMYVEVDFGRPQITAGLVMMTPDPMIHLPFDFYGRESGRWRLLISQFAAVPRQVGDVRMGATRAIRGAGYRYILASTSKDQGNGEIGAAMAEHPAEWGLERVAGLGPAVLFRIR